MKRIRHLGHKTIDKPNTIEKERLNMNLLGLNEGGTFVKVRTKLMNFRSYESKSF